MASVRLTRRGRVVVAACLLGVVMAVAAGGRSLNAVVLSGGVALVAGYLQVARIETPRVERSRPDDGAVGDTREVSIAFHGTAPGESIASPFVARVTDGLDDGLDGDATAMSTTVGAEPVSYTVRYAARGERRFGPVTLEATDVFGLFTRRMDLADETVVLAYPQRQPVPARFRRGLYADGALGQSRQREEFDRLREYARGDALRDVHWPATAKHDGIVVKEFAAETDDRRVSIVGRTAAGEGDAAADVLASATASLGLALLADGVSVDVTLPAGTVAAAPGPTGRRSLLELTARTGPGDPAVDADQDVLVVADEADAWLRAGDSVVSFADLRSEAAVRTGSDGTDAVGFGDGTGGVGSGDGTGPVGSRDGTATGSPIADGGTESAGSRGGGERR